MATAATDRSRRLLITLAIACAVLLLTTVGFGATAAWLWLDRGTAASAEPTPSPSPGTSGEPTNAPQQVRGYEVTVVSEIVFGDFAMTAPDSNGYTILFATMTNESSNQVANHFFDITAYREDGTIIERRSTGAYILPNQTTLFQGIFAEDISDAAAIRIEQSRTEWVEPALTGDITLDAARSGEEGYIEGDFTSGLSAAAEYSDIFIVGFVEGEIFAVCSDLEDIPAAGGTFAAECYLEPASKGDLVDPGEIPEDATFAAYLSVDTLFGD
ncbi:hypothetical protein [Microbacterium sp.]|uniref:hypothetical protein n=1 Tax=Microbacterium sp. TaxID=51671 RepID=UPI002810F024|nr:hypothetical protein [Microbacterium sp.]